MWFFMWVIYFTCRKSFHISEKLRDVNCIATFWHGEFLMLPFAYLKLRKKPKIFVITSKHFHGEMIARVCHCFGFKTIRGSTNYNGVDRGGMKVLLESFKKLRQDWDMGITPDGPKGPYHSIANGVIAMGQKTKVPLSAFRVKNQRFWELRTWDRFQIPKPFSKIDFFLSDPFVLEDTLNEQEARAKIYEKMQAL